MKKFTKLFAGLLTVTMLFSACNSNGGDVTGANNDAPEQTQSDDGGQDDSTEETSGNGADQDQEPVELRFSWWGSEDRHEAMEEVARLYMEKNPHVTITTEYGPWDGWPEKVLTQLAGNTEPDVFQVNYNWIHSFGRGENVFYDLNQVSDYLDLSNWEQEQLDAMFTGGEQSAVPHGVTARMHLYNKELFAEYGIDYPLTYEDFIAAGQLIGADNVDGGGDNKYVHINIANYSTDLFIAQMLFDMTGKIMQENGQINYTVEEVTAAYEMYKSFEDANAIPTFQMEDPMENESNPMWTNGRAGSVYEWVGTLDKYLESYKGGEAKDEIGVAPYIIKEEGFNPKIYVKPNLGYAISKNTAHPEVAADFLNFMFTDEDAVIALGTSLGISSNKVTRAIQEKEDMLAGAMKEGYELLENYDKIVMDPYFEDSNVRGERYIATEAFRTGVLSAAEAAEQYINNQQAALDDFYK